MIRNCFTLLILFLSHLLLAQSNPILEGKIVNTHSKPIENAEVYTIDGLSHTFSDQEGNYSIELSEGENIIQISARGYSTIEDTIVVTNESKIVLNKILYSQTTTELSSVNIVVSKSKELEATLIEDQKKSTFIIENIGAKELDRKGVTDVASAVTKMAGISKQEGSNVIFVRGLGDRYNSTTLNGLPIPSNDPEYKNLDLGILSTDILSHVELDKTFNGFYFGDFAGGNINIVTKKQTSKGFISIGLSSKANANAISDSKFKLQEGISKWGFASVKNPRRLDRFAFQNPLNPSYVPALGNGISLSLGQRFHFEGEKKLSFYLTTSFDRGFESIKEGKLRSGINAQDIVQGKDFDQFESFQYNTQTTGFFNALFQPNLQNQLSFNSIFVNSSNQKLEEGFGYMRDNANEGGYLRRGTYVQNQLWINQLLGEHRLNSQSNINWGIAYNQLTSKMPDRFQNMVEWKSSLNQFVLANSSASLNHRYFQELEENELAANLSYNLRFLTVDNEVYKGELLMGYNARIKSRNFEAMQYNLAPKNGQMVVDFYDLDAFYNQANFDNGLFTINTFSGQSLQPQFYEGEQYIHGGFANISYKFSPKFNVNLGLRVEQVRQSVSWNTSLDPKGNKNKLDEIQLLPNLNLKYELNSKQNLRFAASKTYTLPQFKERALFMYEELGETVYGWPTTYASTDYNLDLKWELFPKINELLSLALFGKYIENPINKFTVASSTNDISYANTGDWGYVYGAELELRKNLYKSTSINPLQIQLGSNISYAKTHQELNNEKVYIETLLSNGSRLNANFTNAKDRFQGASDWLVNADITFQKFWSPDANLIVSLVYNYFSDRIYALGTDNRGNIVELGLSTLDFIVKSKINSTLGIQLKAQNLLNPTFQRVQQNSYSDVTVLSYKKGAQISLGINFQF